MGGAGGGTDSAGPPERPRVVFADDSATQRALVGALLGESYAVEAVESGEAALRTILANPPDVILCDLRMPGIPGDEVLRRVKGDPSLRRIPFILITGEERSALRTMTMGADDFLSKPYGPEELNARVSAAVRSHRMYQELQAQHAELVRIHQASRQLELELRQAQKLEAVGRLAAGIAHEINTPIQFIGDNTGFLAEAFEGLAAVLQRQREALAALAPPPEVAQGLAQLEEELGVPYLLEQVPLTIGRTMEGVRRVATIVRAMKEFAHPDQKDMVATDLNRSLHATLEVARNEYKFVADVVTDLGELPPVTCHSGDINQVFLNVIVNAAHAIAEVVKGTPAKGTITIGTRLDGEAVVVSIGDTGGGIPDQVRDRIFEPFFTTKEVGRGTGQGLAISRNVVEKHRGSITFETAPGQGTTFLIRLPLDGRPAARAAGAPS